uniref:Putative inactive receptor kinase n=1 Tax=Aegilops tauschii TaxID=37682 RepID=M8CG97_AEGTA
MALLLSLALQLAAAAVSPPGPRPTFPGDAAALASLKAAVDAATVPSYSCLASWDFSRDPCAAFPCGVHCNTPPNSSHQRVAGVSLDPAGYSGTLPAPVFASLPFLQTLSLRGNRFHGSLPAGVALPPSLRVLVLSGNDFSGEIPTSLFTPASSLDELDLSRNAFTGAIPPQLLEVDLSGNRITGRLPRCLGAIPRLRTVGLDRNQFVGGVPKQYAVRAAAVEVVDGKAPFAKLMLQGNYLCGGLPSELRQMEEGGAMVSLADNCLLKCPHKFFFCQGPPQKNRAACPKCEPGPQQPDKKSNRVLDIFCTAVTSPSPGTLPLGTTKLPWHHAIDSVKKMSCLPLGILAGRKK